MKNTFQLLILFLTFFSFLSCKNSNENTSIKIENKSFVSYANGFSIENYSRLKTRRPLRRFFHRQCEPGAAGGGAHQLAPRAHYLPAAYTFTRSNK